MSRCAVICLLVQQFIALVLSDGSYSAYKRLHDDLLRDYYPELLPALNADHPVNVSLALAIVNFDLNEDQNSLYVNGWITEEWNDFRLTWDPNAYDGITSHSVNYKNLWYPDISLYNSYEPQNMSPPDDESQCVLSSNGNVLMVRHVGFKSNCYVKRQSNEAMCDLRFGSWVNSAAKRQKLAFSSLPATDPNNHSATIVRIGNQSTAFNLIEIDLRSRQQTVDVSFLNPNPKWVIDNTEVKREAKKYPCCPEIYVDINFQLGIKRTP